MANKDYITFDGRMDDKAWENAQVYTNFQRINSQGGGLAEAQTIFKILPMEDRVYFGLKCLEPDMQQVIESDPKRDLWGSDRVELFVSPTGSAYEYYQFVVFFNSKTVCYYYAEGGQIRPDPYAPEWNSAVYVGEDHWSLVMEIPLKALYMTPNDSMSDMWLLNAIRCRTEAGKGCTNSSCAPLERIFVEFEHYLHVEGMPKRALENDIRIVSAALDLREKNENGYKGDMTVKTLNGVDGTFTFTSDHGDTTEVSLKAGANEFAVPCSFAELGRHKISLALTRTGDGEVFKRYYPVVATYEPIKLCFTLPEYRCNFYPGQDYSKVVGRVIAAKPVTLKLEGPGIETQVKSPDADGSFVFDTPNFEYGEAWLTATMDGEEKKQRIRRLAPTGHTMSWISGGNLIVDGKAVLPRTMYSPYYAGGEVFRKRYDNDNIHETREIKGSGWMKPDVFLEWENLPLTEVQQDGEPSEFVKRKLRENIEAKSKTDYVYHYPYDEPECRGVSPIYVKNVYEYIAEKDPYHVVMMTTRSAGEHADCADWFEVHPYIAPENMPDGRRVFGRPINTMGNYIDDIAKLNRSDKCIGFLPTTFSYEFSSIYADYPTFDELICHTWAAMIHGGKSLDPYAYHDVNDRAAMYEGMRYVFGSFEALEDFMLFGKREVLLRTNDAEAVLYNLNDEQMFVLVNFNQTPQTVTVDGISGTWHEFRHNRTITGNTFEMQPFEVVIGTSEVRDARMPSYQETKELIDAKEYERTHTGNLLFGKQNEINVTAAGVTAHRKWKMFDGVRDNFALQVLGSGERFYELDLTKVKPSFDKVVVSGWHLDGINLKLRVNGELVEPEIIEATNKELSTVTFVLKEKVCPEALRLEFTSPSGMEIYEIEVF